MERDAKELAGDLANVALAVWEAGRKVLGPKPDRALIADDLDARIEALKFLVRKVRGEA